MKTMEWDEVDAGFDRIGEYLTILAAIVRDIADQDPLIRDDTFSGPWVSCHLCYGSPVRNEADFRHAPSCAWVRANQARDEILQDDTQET